MYFQYLIPCWLFLQIIDSLRQWHIICSSIKRPKLYHVVHQVNDGVDPCQLLLQLPGVLPQLHADLAPLVPQVVLLRLAAVNGFDQTGRLTP